MIDSFDLQRFVDAQDPVYQEVLAELRAGRKVTHWMWFIFPQHRDLGRSANAKHYGITSLEEAVAYLRHPVLGLRLKECTVIVLDLTDKTVSDIFPYRDDLKFRSCMTLFTEAEDAGSVFDEAVGKYFFGVADAATTELLRRT